MNLFKYLYKYLRQELGRYVIWVSVFGDLGKKFPSG